MAAVKNTAHHFTLNTGDKIPAIGLGTWQVKSQNAIEVALKAGYRHIDMPSAYGNEAELSNEDHGRVAEALDESLAKLGVDYLVVTDKVKNIGVSNFGIRNLEIPLNDASCKVVPSVNQVELHPCNPSPKVVPYAASKGIHSTGYSCLGSTNSPLYANYKLRALASAKSKTIQQVLLVWGIRKGWSVIPKSATPARIKDNFDIDGWSLTGDEVKAIDGVTKRFKIFTNDSLPIKVFFGDKE